jgi:hypothetical protein
MVTPREEVNRLGSEAYKAALFMLQQQRNFEPFSLVLLPTGGIQIVMAVLDPTRPSTIEQRAEYAQFVLAQMIEKGEARATAFIARMQLRLADRDGWTEALVIEITHPDDLPVNVYVPFRWEGEKLILENPVARRRVPPISASEFAEGASLRAQAAAFLQRDLPAGIVRDMFQGAVELFVNNRIEFPRGYVRMNRVGASVLRSPTEPLSEEAKRYYLELADLLDAIADFVERIDSSTSPVPSPEGSP